MCLFEYVVTFELARAEEWEGVECRNGSVGTALVSLPLFVLRSRNRWRIELGEVRSHLLCAWFVLYLMYVSSHSHSPPPTSPSFSPSNPSISAMTFCTSCAICAENALTVSSSISYASHRMEKSTLSVSGFRTTSR